MKILYALFECLKKNLRRQLVRNVNDFKPPRNIFSDLLRSQLHEKLSVSCVRSRTIINFLQQKHLIGLFLGYSCLVFRSFEKYVSCCFKFSQLFPWREFHCTSEIIVNTLIIFQLRLHRPCSKAIFLSACSRLYIFSETLNIFCHKLSSSVSFYVGYIGKVFYWDSFP